MDWCRLLRLRPESLKRVGGVVVVVLPTLYDLIKRKVATANESKR
jgi:hypothetical protein